MPSLISGQLTREPNMSNISYIFSCFRSLSHYKPAKLMLLFVLSLILGVSQGFSIILLIPFLQLLDVNELASSNKLILYFNTMFDKIGITLNLEVILFTYAIVLILIAVLLYLKSINQSNYQQGFSFQLRQRLFRKLICSDWHTLNIKSKHNHLQVLTEEVPKVSMYYNAYLRMITNIVIILAHIFFAFLLSVKFTLLVLIGGLFTFLFLRKYLNRSYKLGTEAVSLFNRLLKSIDDFWTTIKIAKIHNTEEFHYEKFEEVNEPLFNTQYELLKNRALSQLFFKVIAVIVLVSVVYFGYRIEQIPLASFFILIILFGRMLPLYMSVNNEMNQMFSNIASVKMVAQYDEQFEDLPFSKKGYIEDLVIKKEIRFENVDYSYPGHELLFAGFNALIPANNITGVIGQSGKGKTTLIDLLTGLQKPNAGRIFFDRKPFDAELIQQWSSHIGYLPQEVFFIDGTIRENLVWDSTGIIADNEIWAVLKQVNAVELVEKQKSQLDTKIFNFQHQYSGGELQRLALARVLLRKPTLLLLDEATSSLDIENEKLIMDVLTSLRSKITILFVTHRTSLFPYFDQIIELD